MTRLVRMPLILSRLEEDGVNMKMLVVLLLLADLARGQVEKADPQVQAACREAEAVVLPPEFAAVRTPGAYPVCDSYKLYDGKKFDEARTCAMQERAALLARVKGSPDTVQNEEGNQPPAGGLVVLTEIYANGQGVARNGALAARLFCEGIETGEVDNDVSETKETLATLKRLQSVNANPAHVDFCNAADRMSPLPDTPWTQRCRELAEEAHAEMHAGGIQEGVDDAQQDADAADEALAPVKAKFTPAQAEAFGKVAAVMQRFIDAQATGDLIYMGGYGSGGLYPNEMHAAFENEVVALAVQLPVTPAAGEFAAADAELNAVYRKLVAAATPGGNVAGRPLNPENLKSEQRAWIAYRDAFVAFGKTLAPALPAQAWMLPLTRSRTEDLKNVANLAVPDLVGEREKEQAWREHSLASAESEAAQAQQEVAEYFAHQTPAQAAAWERVKAAAHALAAAHAAAVTREDPGYESKTLRGLYLELYAARYNLQHGFKLDAAKAQAGFVANEARLNEGYTAALACAQREVVRGPRYVQSAERLQEEERAWLKLRDAWAEFLALVFPAETLAERSNMITGGRAFQLQMYAEGCSRNSSQ